jgi:hypothetical protein
LAFYSESLGEQNSLVSFITHFVYYFWSFPMRTFFAPITILSAIVNNDNDTITGKAFDNDISIDYTVKLNEANRAVYVPGALLVVTGSLRINNKQISSVIAWINEIIYVGFVPEPEVIEAPAELVEAMAEILDAPVEAVTEIFNAPPEVLQAQSEAVAELVGELVEVSADVISKARKSSKRKALVETDAELIPF